MASESVRRIGSFHTNGPAATGDESKGVPSRQAQIAPGIPTLGANPVVELLAPYESTSCRVINFVEGL
jgi:hypothetical protein